MGNMTVRNLPDDVHDRLRQQATSNRRSLEAEVRSILVQSILASSSAGVGQRLRARFGKDVSDDLTFERDKTPNEPMSFE